MADLQEARQELKVALLHSALLVQLAQEGVPPDVLELLVQGNPDLGVTPWPLSRALKRALADLKYEDLLATVPRAAFSIQETADQLGLSVATVYRAIERGDLEAVKLGGRRLIPARCIEKLLAAKAG